MCSKCHTFVPQGLKRLHWNTVIHIYTHFLVIIQYSGYFQEKHAPRGGLCFCPECLFFKMFGKTGKTCILDKKVAPSHTKATVNLCWLCFADDHASPPTGAGGFFLNSNLNLLTKFLEGVSLLWRSDLSKAVARRPGQTRETPIFRDICWDWEFHVFSILNLIPGARRASSVDSREAHLLVVWWADKMPSIWQICINC